MKNKTIRKVALAFFLLLPAIAIAHYALFPTETNCILIGFSDFKRTGNIYYEKNIPSQSLHALQQTISSAEKKNRLFWQQNIILDYKLICCATEKEFIKYAPAGVPAATNIKLGAYIVIQKESMDENIIAHEIAHTVLYRNIGWYKRTFSIPAWFEEGLAMQVDDRDYYSIDSSMAKKNKGIKLPDVLKLEKAADFFSGETETIMLNFSTSKYVVAEWLKTHSLKNFIKKIQEGSSFKNAFAQATLEN